MITDQDRVRDVVLRTNDAIVERLPKRDEAERKLRALEGELECLYERFKHLLRAFPGLSNDETIATMAERLKVEMREPPY